MRSRAAIPTAVVIAGLAITTGIRLAARHDASGPSSPATAAPVTALVGSAPIPSTRRTSPASVTGPATTIVVATDATTTLLDDSSRSAASATHAAVRFLDLDEELFPPVSAEKARALTESMASTASKSRLGQQAFDHQTQILAKGNPGGLILRIAPIAARTRNCRPVACTVDVFFLRLWSFPAQGALDDYATATINLVWQDGSWRLDSSTLIDGPYPAGRYSAHPGAAANSKVFEADLAGFNDTKLTDTELNDTELTHTELAHTGINDTMLTR